MVRVLNFSELFADAARVVIVDKGDRAYDDRVWSSSLLGYQPVADQVAKSLGSVGIAPLADGAVKALEKVGIERNADSTQDTHKRSFVRARGSPKRGAA
jgi:hypothetical protein